jgi:chemotaxis protein histidine kinase CheA
MPPPFHAPTVSPVEEVKPVTTAATAVTQTAAAVAPAATALPAKSAKKSTAWLSYVLALLVFGGVGYFIYQDMEKNKGNNSNVAATSTITDSTANNSKEQPSAEQPATATTTTTDTAGTEATTEPATTTTPGATVTAPATATTTQPATAATATTTVPSATTTVPSATTAPSATTKPDAATIKAQKEAAQKLALKKIEEEKKKQQAALAAAALKEKEYRNNWQKYITTGRLDFNANGNGIGAFNVPVHNGTNAILDKVTVRVDYMKKDKKVVKSETIIIYNIPPGQGSNGSAPESKRGDNVKVFITGVTSRKLHFCYPGYNGNAADPYFCN